LCLTAQYRNFLDFSEDLLQTAQHSRENLIKKIQKLFDEHSKVIVDIDHITSYEKLKDKITSKYVGDALEDMMAALMDDLNTPQLLAVLNQSLNALDKAEEVEKKEFFVALYWLEKKLLKI
jgi:cysteinyl-tRNA synthetase